MEKDPSSDRELASGLSSEELANTTDVCVDSEPTSIGIGIGGAGGSAPALDDSIVDWDGPEDHENPQNWTSTRKWIIIISVSAITFNQQVQHLAGWIIDFWC